MPGRTPWATTIIMTTITIMITIIMTMATIIITIMDTLIPMTAILTVMSPRERSPSAA